MIVCDKISSWLTPLDQYVSIWPAKRGFVNRCVKKDQAATSSKTCWSSVT